MTTLVLKKAESREGINTKNVLARIKTYMLDNAAFFATSAVLQSGNGYAAAQIMRQAVESSTKN